jgi:hypothetical protein
MPGSRTERRVADIFISYAGANRPWAEWIAVELLRDQEES